MYMILYGMIVFLCYLLDDLFSIPLAIYGVMCLGIILYVHKNKKKCKIFVSYTVRDNSIDYIKLQYINKILTFNKFSCYIDLLHNNSINKQEKVYRELLSADIFLKINSRDYNNSEWTKREFLIAKETKKKIIEINYNDNKNQILNKIKKVKKQI